jgi:dienelactone hydrolase
VIATRGWWRRAAAAVVAAAIVFGAGTADAAKKKRKSSKKKPVATKKQKKPEPPPVPRPADPYRVTLTTPDGVALAATWRAVPDRPDAPAVLLVHDFARERRPFAPVQEELLARGLSSLALELRGHGESTHKGKVVVKLAPRLMSDPNAFPVDVETACTWLRSRARKVGVLGLSLGGNLAVLAAANGWADAAVAVSPNVERLAPLAGSRSRAARAILILASENDTGRPQSAKQISDAAREPKKTLLLPGAAHAMDLLLDPRAKSAAYEWLVERLGAAPATPTRTPTAPPTPVYVPAEFGGFGSTPSTQASRTPTPAPPAPAPVSLESAPAPTPGPGPFGEIVPPSPPATATSPTATPSPRAPR